MGLSVYSVLFTGLHFSEDPSEKFKSSISEKYKEFLGDLDTYSVRDLLNDLMCPYDVNLIGYTDDYPEVIITLELKTYPNVINLNPHEEDMNIYYYHEEQEEMLEWFEERFPGLDLGDNFYYRAAGFVFER